MSGRECRDTSRVQDGNLNKRRRSLLYRITDTITSFLPSLFESREETDSEIRARKVQCTESPSKKRRISTASEIPVQSRSSLRCPNRLSISPIDGVQIPSESLSVPAVNVDLDAVDDISDYSFGSKASITTSGVSSLLPRNYRNGPTLVKPLSKDYRSEYIGLGNNNNRKRGNTDHWTDFETSSQSPLDVTQSASKKMRKESTKSSLFTAFSSPFYGGNVSYGGASSLRTTSQSNNGFEHVAPLRFIMETNEEQLPRNQPSSSNAMLSATAQRILNNLERHRYSISSNNKILLPAPVPFSSSSKPLQRSTTRYPSYMATYNRYKEFKRQVTQSALALSQPAAHESNEKHNAEDLISQQKHNGSVTRSQISAVSTASEVSVSTSQIQSPKALPVVIYSSQPIACFPTAGLMATGEANKSAHKVGSFNACTSSASVSILPKAPMEKNLLQSPTNFTFSAPITLEPPTQPVTHSGVPKFIFTTPRSQFKKPVPNENSFLSTLMSPRQSEVPIQRDSPKISIPSNIDLWRCESCLTENSERDGVCKSCCLPTFFTSVPKTTALAISDKPALFGNLPNGWECPTCLVKNKTEMSKCVCCQTLNPSSKVDIDSTNDKSSTAMTFNFGPPISVSSNFTKAESAISNSGFKFGISSSSSGSGQLKFGASTFDSNNGWVCPTCQFKNDESSQNCPCTTLKPKSSASSAISFNFGNPAISNAAISAVGVSFGNQPGKLSTGFKFGNDTAQKNKMGFNFGEIDKKWECPTCLVRNDAAIASCPCCQTKKPASIPKPTCSSPSNNGDNLDGSTNASDSCNTGDKWDCATCLVKNNAFASRCVCCQSEKPDPNSSFCSLKNADSAAQYADSPPVIMSSVKQSTHLNTQNSSDKTIEVVRPISSLSTSVGTSSLPFSKPADASSNSVNEFKLGYKPATFAPPVKPSGPSGLKNSGFLFGSPVATPAFDFSAKKENMTPIVSAPSAGFNFQSPPTLFKFGEPKLTSSGNSGNVGVGFNSTENTNGSTIAAATSTPQETGLYGRPIRRAVRRQNRE